MSVKHRQKFTKDDLQIGMGSQIMKKDGLLLHTHMVLFGRALTQAERHLFTTVLTSFYYTVRFSRQFGDGLVSEPVVEFKAPNRASYTLKHSSQQGQWKELLFAMLANFSYEIAPIAIHDDSRVFDPNRSLGEVESLQVPTEENMVRMKQSALVKQVVT